MSLSFLKAPSTDMCLTYRKLGFFETLMKLTLHVAPALIRCGNATPEVDFWGHLRDLD